jgi:MFS superfamily sulfate permease-like transporter
MIKHNILSEDDQDALRVFVSSRITAPHLLLSAAAATTTTTTTDPSNPTPNSSSFSPTITKTTKKKTTIITTTNSSRRINHNNNNNNKPLPTPNIFSPTPYITSIIKTSQRILDIFLDLRNIRRVHFVSGIIVSLLVFAYNLVFASILFDEVGLTQYGAVGFEMQALASLVSGMTHVLFSDVGTTIASPDVFSTIFLSQMAGIIKDIVVQEAMRDNPTEFTTSDITLHSDQVRHRILCTFLTAMTLSTGILGVILILVGKFKLTRIISFLPAPTLAGMVASIGASGLVKGLKASMPFTVYTAGPVLAEFWMYALPGVPMGIAMYLQRRKQWGDTTVVLPLILIIPLCLFYIILFSSGGSFESARSDGWVFQTHNSTQLYIQYTSLYGPSPSIAWNALSDCTGPMLILWIVVVTDVLLKQAGTRRNLDAYQLRFPHETELAGKANLLGCFLLLPPAYGQMKFTAITSNVVKSTTTRIPGIINATIQGLLFFIPISLSDYLPRFWIAGLLYYAACGFLWENMVDIRTRVRKTELLEIWIMVIFSQAFGFVYALIAGLAITMILYAMSYTAGGGIKDTFKMNESPSSIIRNEEDELLLQNLSRTAVVVRLHNYVFFRFSWRILDYINNLMDEQEKLDPGQGRVQYIIFDFTDTSNVDFTSIHVFLEIAKRVANIGAGENDEAPSWAFKDRSESRRLTLRRRKTSHMMTKKYREKVIIVFAGMNTKVRGKFQRERVLTLLHASDYRDLYANGYLDKIPVGENRVFNSLDDALIWTEDMLLMSAARIRENWFMIPPFLKINAAAELARERRGVSDLMGHRELGSKFWNFVTRVHVTKGQRIIGAGEKIDQVETTATTTNNNNMTSELSSDNPLFVRNHNISITLEGGTPIDTNLYLLEKGQLEVWKNGRKIHRATPGVFLNVDAVFVDLPDPTDTVVLAEVDSDVLVITREQMIALEEQWTHVAMLLRKNILKFSTRMRVRAHDRLGGQKGFAVLEGLSEQDEMTLMNPVELMRMRGMNHVTTTTTSTSATNNNVGSNSAIVVGVTGNENSSSAVGGSGRHIQPSINTTGTSENHIISTVVLDELTTTNHHDQELLQQQQLQLPGLDTQDYERGEEEYAESIYRPRLSFAARAQAIEVFDSVMSQLEENNVTSSSNALPVSELKNVMPQLRYVGVYDDTEIQEATRDKEFLSKDDFLNLVLKVSQAHFPPAFVEMIAREALRIFGTPIGEDEDVLITRGTVNRITLDITGVGALLKDTIGQTKTTSELIPVVVEWAMGTKHESTLRLDFDACVSMLATFAKVIEKNALFVSAYRSLLKPDARDKHLHAADLMRGLKVNRRRAYQLITEADFERKGYLSMGDVWFAIRRERPVHVRKKSIRAMPDISANTTTTTTVGTIKTTTSSLDLEKGITTRSSSNSLIPGIIGRKTRVGGGSTASTTATGNITAVVVAVDNNNTGNV